MEVSYEPNADAFSPYVYFTEYKRQTLAEDKMQRLSLRAQLAAAWSVSNCWSGSRREERLWAIAQDEFPHFLQALEGFNRFLHA